MPEKPWKKRRKKRAHFILGSRDRKEKRSTEESVRSEKRAKETGY